MIFRRWEFPLEWCRLLTLGMIAAAASILSFSLPAIAAPPASNASDARASEEHLVRLVAEALANNPEIEQSEAEWQMYIHRAARAGTFEDPMLMVGINNGLLRDPLDFTRENMTSKLIGVSQQLPYFGKRELRRQSAEQDILSARARFEERRLQLAALVKETYARLFAVQQALDVIARNIRIMDDVVQFTETRYGVGTGMQQDVLRAQVERSRMIDMQIGLLQQQRSLQATMNRLLARPEKAGPPRIERLETPPVELDAARLEALARERRPLLRGLQAQIRKNETETSLAERDYYPDFIVTLEYMQREEAMESAGYDMYSAQVSFNLPVQRQRREAMVAETVAQRRMAQAELAAAYNDIRGGIEDLLAQLQRSSELIDLYRTAIIPQASRAFESAQIAYSNNQTDFEMMFENLLTLFNYERQYYEMQADYRMSLAQLEALVGADLDAVSPAPAPAIRNDYNSPVHGLSNTAIP